MAKKMFGSMSYDPEEFLCLWCRQILPRSMSREHALSHGFGVEAERMESAKQRKKKHVQESFEFD